MTSCLNFLSFVHVYLLELKSVLHLQLIEVIVSKLEFLMFVAWIEGTAIFVAVFVVAFVGSWNDYQKEI